MGTYDDPLKMLNKTKAKQTPTPNTLTCSIFLKMKIFNLLGLLNN